MHLKLLSKFVIAYAHIIYQKLSSVLRGKCFKSANLVIRLP